MNKPIENSPNLIKDTSNEAVINTDKQGYKSALIRKRKNKELNNLKKEIEQLNKRLSELEKIVLS